MSARVLNPAATMMTEMSRIGSSASTPPTSIGSSGGRAQPSRAALAKVRRDLFGPVDHVAARALAEKELKAQSVLDTERWGFDFRLEVPKNGGGSRFEWEIVTAADYVPEPYALRGMPYIRRNTPSSPRKSSLAMRSPRIVRLSDESPTIPTPIKDVHKAMLESERTPPQESRNLASLTETTLTTPDVVPAIAGLSFRSKERRSSKTQQIKQRRSSCTNTIDCSSSTTPGQTRKQTSITDFMKSRKRTLNGSAKIALDSSPPAKVARKAGQILS